MEIKSVSEEPQKQAKHEGSKIFVFHEKDLASENSLWDLYERWSCYHSKNLDEKEKYRRFSTFKETAKYVHDFNLKNDDCKLSLNEFSDLTIDEFGSWYSGSGISKFVFPSKPWHRVLQQNLHKVKIDAHENVSANNETLIKAVANQSGSVAIDACGSNFQFYSERIHQNLWQIARPWCRRGGKW